MKTLLTILALASWAPGAATAQEGQGMYQVDPIQVVEIHNAFQNEKYSDKVLKCVAKVSKQLKKQNLELSATQGFMGTLENALELSKVSLSLAELLESEGLASQKTLSNAKNNNGGLNSTTTHFRSLLNAQVEKEKAKAKNVCKWLDDIQKDPGHTNNDIYSMIKDTILISGIVTEYAVANNLTETLGQTTLISKLSLMDQLVSTSERTKILAETILGNSEVMELELAALPEEDLLQVAELLLPSRYFVGLDNSHKFKEGQQYINSQQAQQFGSASVDGFYQVLAKVPEIMSSLERRGWTAVATVTPVITRDLSGTGQVNDYVIKLRKQKAVEIWNEAYKRGGDRIFKYVVLNDEVGAWPVEVSSRKWSRGDRGVEYIFDWTFIKE